MDLPESKSLASNSDRFTAQAHTLEDRLKADTVGLVQLSDFRKRRAEALGATQDDSAAGSRASTPEGRETSLKPSFRKRKKHIKKGGLSFGDDDGDIGDDSTSKISPVSDSPSIDAQDASVRGTDSTTMPEDQGGLPKKRAIIPNASIAVQPKAMTKASLLREAQLRDSLKKEYEQIRDAVKATEVMVPFVFYDGKEIPGGMCRMKKGDFVWLFLERARKVGATLVGRGDYTRRDWARIGVDDLMMVKGDIIIPHHYDFYYFIVNQSAGYKGTLFPYSSQPALKSPTELSPEVASPGPTLTETISHLQTAEQRKKQAAVLSGPKDSELEGYNDAASLTKVVDRRWYERNKHIYPASTWEDFDPEKDYNSDVRKDAGGNTMFFSR